MLHSTYYGAVRVGDLRTTSSGGGGNIECRDGAEEDFWNC